MIEAARRKWAQILAERRLSATSVWPLLQDYLVRTKSTGCSYIDYWHLHLAVQRYRPQLILELGTGASTIVLAEAAKGYGFVDGPAYKTKSGEITFDLDLIRVVEKAEVPVRGLIDKRISTCFVMQRVLPGKVRYARHLGLGFVEAVTRADLRGIDPTTPSTSFKLGTLIDFDGL